MIPCYHKSQITSTKYQINTNDRNSKLETCMRIKENFFIHSGEIKVTLELACFGH